MTRGYKPNPIDSPRPKFYLSERAEINEKVYNEKGKIVAERPRKVRILKEIPSSEFENKGITEDMFYIENLQKAGINPQLMSGPMIRATLEQKSVIQDYLEGADYDQIFQVEKGEELTTTTTSTTTTTD